MMVSGLLVRQSTTWSAGHKHCFERTSCHYCRLSLVGTSFSCQQTHFFYCDDESVVHIQICLFKMTALEKPKPDLFKMEFN